MAGWLDDRRFLPITNRPRIRGLTRRQVNVVARIVGGCSLHVTPFPSRWAILPGVASQGVLRAADAAVANVRVRHSRPNIPVAPAVPVLFPVPGLQVRA